MTEKRKTPTQQNAAKIDAVLSLMDDIIDAMHLPVHESDRLKRAVWKVRNADN